MTVFQHSELVSVLYERNFRTSTRTLVHKLLQYKAGSLKGLMKITELNYKRESYLVAGESVWIDVEAVRCLSKMLES